MSAVGQLFVVGIGPGRRDLVTTQAIEALRQADVVVGYAGYFAWIEDLAHGKERIALDLGQEEERAHAALRAAAAGHRVALISSGDPGIYAMASLVIELMEDLPRHQQPDLTV